MEEKMVRIHLEELETIRYASLLGCVALKKTLGGNDGEAG